MGAYEQSAVLDYIKPLDQSTLIFRGFDDSKVNVEKLSFDNIVELCVKLSEDHWSIIEETNEVECDPDRYRSSLDIWRHVKHFLPNATIFDVMHSLWDNKDSYIGQYCCDIYRRVFKHKGNWSDELYYVDPDDYYTDDGDFDECSLECEGDYDEYGFLFPDWNNV